MSLLTSTHLHASKIDDARQPGKTSQACESTSAVQIKDQLELNTKPFNGFIAAMQHVVLSGSSVL
jgi:hypothetical protein